MENHGWKIQIIESPGQYGRDIYIYCRVPNGTMFVQPDQTVVTVPFGEATDVKPAFHLDPEQLQALADELSRVGYKPEKGFVNGKLEATESHLADLRKLLKLK